jgi:hypothetical protein
MTKYVRWFGFTGAVVFALVGAAFFLFPEGVLSFFNGISGFFHMKPAPVAFPGFYLILTAAYMYVVTIVAFEIFRHPENPAFLVLLANAKIASSLLSLVLLFRDAFYLIYLVNFIADGCIGLVALWLYTRMKK